MPGGGSGWSRRIAVATSGRFHALDLARELDALGHEVTFYSCVPRGRARSFGLEDRSHVSLLPVMAPIALARRIAPNISLLSQWESVLLDSLLARLLKPCDVLIAMSGIFLKTLRTAKRKYGATVILERGSQHIVSQDRILRAMPGGKPIAEATVQRELSGYREADYISVPSRHVIGSFVELGVPAQRLLYNPYGCDLQMFPATIRDHPAQRTILFVGLWSLQKGCDILLQAWRTLENVKLIHVGPVGDLALPDDERFVHVPTVPQQHLSRFYAGADILVLPSRQDGFGMVLSQALASGLPVVCTTMTGGRDLREMLYAPDAIIEVEPEDPAELRAAIVSGLQRAERQPQGTPRVVVQDREGLSWRRYGERYNAHLKRIFAVSE